MVPREVVAFLNGESSLNGRWFGDIFPSRMTGNFWWRKHLLAAAETAPPVSDEALRHALKAVHAAMLNGGDGETGDFGWSITELNKARPLIRAAMSAIEQSDSIERPPNDG